MEKIKFPDNLDDSMKPMFFLRDAYRKIRAFCSFEERLWLITGNDGDLEIYVEKLRKLAKKYNLLEEK